MFRVPKPEAKKRILVRCLCTRHTCFVYASSTCVRADRAEKSDTRPQKVDPGVEVLRRSFYDSREQGRSEESFFLAKENDPLCGGEKYLSNAMMTEEISHGVRRRRRKEEEEQKLPPRAHLSRRRASYAIFSVKEVRKLPHPPPASQPVLARPVCFFSPLSPPAELKALMESWPLLNHVAYTQEGEAGGMEFHNFLLLLLAGKSARWPATPVAKPRIARTRQCVYNDLRTFVCVGISFFRWLNTEYECVSVTHSPTTT